MYNFTQSVKFYTQCIILHKVYNFTHSVKFYTQCTILHKVFNFTHSVCILHIIWYVNLSFRMQVYAVLSWGNFCRAFTHWYTGSKATDEKATSSLFVSCLFVGEKVAFLSAQKATMKIFIFGHATGWVCLKRLFYG